MKTFHHGGRFGDLFYALWTVRELGGGKLIVSDYHKGNWSLNMARTLESFLRYQNYIQDVEFVPYSELPPVDYDLQKAEDDYNPEAFPECPMLNEHHWPGEANIAKRYAVHFGLTYRPGETWLEAPNGLSFPVILHRMERRSIRAFEDWTEACWGIEVVEFNDSTYYGDWLATAKLIRNAELFLGVVSGPHALAEGLGKTRFVEQAPDCFNVSVMPPSVCINGWSNQEVADAVTKALGLNKS